MTGNRKQGRHAVRRGGFFVAGLPASRFAALSAALVLLAGCGGGTERAAANAELRDVALPAAANATWPRLRRTPRGAIYASWIEGKPDGVTSLQFAAFDGQRWSRAGRIANGDDWFVNWADYPSVTGSGDHLAAHWLVQGKHGPGTYDVFIAQSSDRGATWSAPRRPYRGGARTEQGFATLLPATSGFDVVWLDGRDPGRYPGGGPTTQRSSTAELSASAGEMGDARGADEMSGDQTGAGAHQGHSNAAMRLRYAHLGFDGRWLDERVLDARTCDCCHTDAARSDAGLVVVYRDRDDAELRDISRVLRTPDGTWLAPEYVAEDGWHIEGCPVNAPAIAARGKHVAVAWYSGVATAPGVRLAQSSDGGVTFGAALRLATGPHVVGRADVVVVDAQGAAVVSWLEQATDQSLRWRLQRIDAQGNAAAVRDIVRLPPGRRSGFPQLLRLDDDSLLVAWTEWEDSVSRVRTATIAATVDVR